MLTAAHLENGERFKVKKVILGKEVGKRLADMGFTKGARGTMIRCALLGDPLEVRIYGYNVSIRRSEAEGIEVEKLQPEKTVSGCAEPSENKASLLEKALQFCFPPLSGVESSMPGNKKSY